jgi:hypothetical protein
MIDMVKPIDLLLSYSDGDDLQSRKNRLHCLCEASRGGQWPDFDATRNAIGAHRDRLLHQRPLDGEGQHACGPFTRTRRERTLACARRRGPSHRSSAAHRPPAHALPSRHLAREDAAAYPRHVRLKTGATLVPPNANELLIACRGRARAGLCLARGTSNPEHWRRARE